MGAGLALVPVERKVGREANGFGSSSSSRSRGTSSIEGKALGNVGPTPVETQSRMHI